MKNKLTIGIEPDLDRISLSIYQKFHAFKTSKDKLFGQIKTERIFHKGGTIYKNENDIIISTLDNISSTSSIHYDDALNYRIEQVSISLYEMSEMMINQMHSNFIKNMNQITNLTGNVLDAQGKKFTLDIINDQLEQIDISFDKDGNPKLPQLYTSPELSKKIAGLEETDEQRKRFEQIIDKKRKEYFARKLTRNLSYID